ncbi:N-acetyltransferase [Proteus cibi]|uniref:N-acetyltransferase n=1 Tax=Proteus cibi TaxID=2050966 RepID=A0ABU6E8Q8_9GAMM|nr:N-acetyltransferase [Proteus cibi]MEB6855429.1 N-acetyltransferase [Proteus cibi]MEB7088578.1 N-acetyltransferase [Proteus cibi]
MNYILQKMTAKDISAVARLLQKNSESQQGGLYGEYPLNKVEAMYQSSTNAIVALDQENIVAVVFSFPVTSFSLPPIAQAINQLFPDITQNNWFYGPVCIDQSHRGKSILKDLYQQICSLHGGHPIAFVNSENIRSLKAHQKLGMKVVKHFEFKGTSWWVIKGQ